MKDKSEGGVTILRPYGTGPQGTTKGRARYEEEVKSNKSKVARPRQGRAQEGNHELARLRRGLAKGGHELARNFVSHRAHIRQGTACAGGHRELGII